MCQYTKTIRTVSQFCENFVHSPVITERKIFWRELRKLKRHLDIGVTARGIFDDVDAAMVRRVPPLAIKFSREPKEIHIAVVHNGHIVCTWKK